MAADAAQSRPAPPAGGLGRGRRRRHDRRDRLHDRAADRDARIRRSAARRGQARDPRRRRRRVARHVAPLPGGAAASPGSAGPVPCWGRASRSSTSTWTSIRSATTFAGPMNAPVTVVEYGDFECPYCGQAEPVVRELLRDFADVRYVWRHLPLNDVHPNAQLAAEAAEAASDQGAFWEMHDLLLEPPGRARTRRPDRLRRAAWSRRRAFHRRPAYAVRRGPRRRGRRQRRPERCLRDADVLHQRQAPPRRLRHPHPLGGSARGRRPGGAGNGDS